jgi:NAD(P)-dependent dehydrogenase (short-subunit alcohol dehydrogenase family)
VATTIDAFGGVDVLVNNAIAPPQMHPLLETTSELAESMWRTGPLGSMYFMQACHPSLRERHGNVVNVGSRAGMDGNEGWAAYAPAKEAIRTLTRVAAREWGRDGIRVNTICPAAASPAYESWAAEHPDLAAIQVAEKALGRYGDCELDIGRAVVLLASDYACYITGNTLMADGGSCR